MKHSGIRLGMAAIWLSGLVAAAQNPGPAAPAAVTPAHFAWAGVMASPATDERGGGLYNGGAIFQDASMLDLIAAAYGVENDRVMGGPAWLSTELYNLRAKGPAGATAAGMQPMLQGFLEERFHLAAHAEQRQLPAYALTVARDQLQAKPAAEGAAPGGCVFRPFSPAEQAAPPGSLPRLDIAVDCKNESMAAFAAALPTLPGAYGYFTDRRLVVDKTGVDGSFDFSLVFMPKQTLLQPSATNYDPTVDISFDDALARLGLKLTPIAAPQTVVVVDAVEEKPLDVPNSATPAPPPMPTEFDVASVKPHDPGAGRGGSRITPGGEVDLIGLPLLRLIIMAYDSDPREVVGLPAWASTDEVDIHAKTVPGATIIDLQPMLQNLLKERFALAMHQERRTVPVVALRAGDHPRLTPTKSGERFHCTSNSADNGNVAMTCTNATMAQFLQNLYDFANGYLDRPVVDLTGIRGSYDIKLTWAPVGMTGYNGAGRGGPAAAGTGSEPAAPLSSLTLFKAVESLGLKLEHETQPVQVTVIDHLERTPTSN